MVNTKNVTTFLAVLAEKVSRGEFKDALEACRQNQKSFVRSYVGIAFLNGLNAEELIVRMNEMFLDNLYKKSELEVEVRFQVNFLKSMPLLVEKVRKTPLYD